jgi:hypothetical protein
MYSALLFAVLATSLALSIRYRQSLEELVANHEAIRLNLALMRTSTITLHKTVTSFRSMLPVGYENRSAEFMLLTRLDEIKTKLPRGELLVNPIQSKNGMLSIEFLSKLENPYYSDVLNAIGTLETDIFPFVTIKSISISGDQRNKPGPISIAITGEIATPQVAPQTTADTPAPVQAVMPRKGAR